MSGLYNTLFGYNRYSRHILEMLAVSENSIPRYRDCYLNEQGTEIIIYTRTGGDNRASYMREIEEMKRIPGYLSDSDDTFDNTYALFRYEVPPPYRADCLLLKDLGAIGNATKAWEDYSRQLSRTGGST